MGGAAATTSGFEEEDEDPGVSSRPIALVLFNPVFDNGPNGYGHSRVKEYWKEISPMHNIGEDTPPTVVFLGTEDDLVPVETAEKYKALMESNGVRCDLHLYPGQPHGFFNFNKPENYTRTVSEMDRFLASLNFVEGEPGLPATSRTPSDKLGETTYRNSEASIEDRVDDVLARMTI